MGILGFVGCRGFQLYTGNPETGSKHSKYKFTKDDDSKDVYEVTAVTEPPSVRCDSIGPGCNSDVVELKDPNGNVKEYNIYGDIVDSDGKELNYYRDIKVGQKVTIEIKDSDDFEGGYITKMTLK